MSWWTDKEELNHIEPEKQEKKTDGLHKDRECISCEKFFDCSGKPKGTNCMFFKERKK